MNRQGKRACSCGGPETCAFPDDCARRTQNRGDGGVKMRRWEPKIMKSEFRCRWCGRKLGDWHDKECSHGQCGDGRVHERDCMKLEYKLYGADPREHLMHDQLRQQWRREVRDDPC